MSEPDVAAVQAALAKASAQERKLIETLYGHQIAAPWAPDQPRPPRH